MAKCFSLALTCTVPYYMSSNGDRVGNTVGLHCSSTPQNIYFTCAGGSKPYCVCLCAASPPSFLQIKEKEDFQATTVGAQGQWPFGVSRISACMFSLRNQGCSKLTGCLPFTCLPGSRSPPTCRRTSAWWAVSAGLRRHPRLTGATAPSQMSSAGGGGRPGLEVVGSCDHAVPWRTSSAHYSSPPVHHRSPHN